MNTIHYSLFTIHYSRRGISLMEVLASVFVIGVGLLGVLAVIPFGAFQVSKVQQAEYGSNMLDAARKDFSILEFAKPTTWRDGNNVDSIGSGTADTSYNNDNDANSKSVLLLSSGNLYVNCTRFFMVDPLDTMSTMNPNRHISKIGANAFNYQNRLDMWQERMRGQDDILYTLHEDKRTDFSGNDNKIMSSGRYAWFFTYKIEPLPAYTGSPTQVPLNSTDLPSAVPVDFLGCYNRAPDADKSVDINLVNSSQYQDGASLELIASNEQLLDLKNTKYIFVTWSTGSANSYRVDGNWCRILNASDIAPSGANYSRYVIVKGDLSNLPSSNNPRAFIADGVLFHIRPKDKTGISILFPIQ